MLQGLCVSMCLVLALGPSGQAFHLQAPSLLTTVLDGLMWRSKNVKQGGLVFLPLPWVGLEVVGSPPLQKALLGAGTGEIVVWKHLRYSFVTFVACLVDTKQRFSTTSLKP